MQTICAHKADAVTRLTLEGIEGQLGNRPMAFGYVTDVIAWCLTTDQLNAEKCTSRVIDWSRILSPVQMADKRFHLSPFTL